MKWGNKYDNDGYLQKLYNGIKRNFKNKFKFFCITDKVGESTDDFIYIPLNCKFDGWMKKSYLFSDEVSKYLSKRICFIDLDMLVYNDITMLSEYDGDFCLMNTNDITCENSKDGYNSSIILWRNGFGKQIYNFMNAYYKHITKLIIRFDHYLEYIMKNSEFIQDVFKGLVLDYNTYCKDKEELPLNGGIVAFPRYPKPHQCNENWLKKYWN